MEDLTITGNASQFGAGSEQFGAVALTEISYVYRPFVYEAKNGTLILIKVFVGDQLDKDGVPALLVEMSVRADKWETWGAPLHFEAAP